MTNAEISNTVVNVTVGQLVKVNDKPFVVTYVGEFSIALEGPRGGWHNLVKCMNSDGWSITPAKWSGSDKFKPVTGFEIVVKN